MTDVRSRTQPGCLDAETLAAFVDGRLNAEARARAEAHIASCEDCYEAFVELASLASEDIGAAGAAMPSAPVARPRSGQPILVWITIGVGLAAAILAVVLIQPAWFVRLVHPSVRPDLVELVAAVGTNRATEGRLTGGFRWGPAPSATRSASASATIAPELQIAAAHLEQALQKNRTPRTLAAFASSALAVGRTDDAITALEEATALEKGDAWLWSDLSAAYLVRARRDGQAVDVPRSLEAADTAVSLAARLPEALFNRALALERLGLKAQAIEAWKQYLTADADSPWAAEARTHLDELTRLSALVAPDGQELRERLFDEVLPRWAADVRADPPSARRDLDAARAIVTELAALSAEPLARDVVQIVADSKPGAQRDDLADGHLAYGRGRSAYLAGKSDEALVEFERAGRALSATGSPLALWATLSKGIARFRQGDLPGSERDISAFSRRLTGSPYDSVTGKTAWMSGLLAVMRGDYASADAAYGRAASLLERAGERGNEAFVRGLIAERLDWLGDPRRAWDARVASLERARRSTAILSGALAAMASGWPHVADDLQDRAVQVARESRDRGDLADALRNRALRFARLGDYATAGRWLAEAKAALDELPNHGGARAQAELDLAAAKCSSASGSDAGIAAATRAFDYFSQAKLTARVPGVLAARAALHRLRREDDLARTDLEHALAALSAQRASVIGTDLRATFGDEVRIVSDALVRLELDAGHDMRAFDVSEYGRSWDLAGTEQSGRLDGRLTSLEAALPDGAVAAVYVVLENETLIWAVTHANTRLHREPITREDLGRLAGVYVASGMPASIGRRLSDVLLAPLAPSLAPGRLLVVLPDGPLHLLPFAALPGIRASTLIEEHPLLVAPGVSLLLRASRQAATFTTLPAAILSIGNPRVSAVAFPGLPALPEAEAEAASIAAAYMRPTVLAGDRATRTALLGLLPDAEVVHFAGHALINEQEPLRSQLVISNGDGPGVTAREIEQLQCPRTRLVVLAACNSASGLVTRSAGPIGLAKAFLAAGVPAVVASYGAVSDRATRMLFERFHEAFRRTGDPATALQAAQIALLRSPDPAATAPATWANFAVIGGVASLGAVDLTSRRR